LSVLLTGTSGWQYRDWRDRFYPHDLAQNRWLEYYASRFTTVEVNNTFYRLPSSETFAAWAGRVPADFVFAIKASRFLTHYKRLVEPEEPVDRLLSRAQPLAKQLAVVLLQLPPDMKSAPDSLDRALRAFGGRVRVAVEVRNSSWWNDDVRAVLETHSAALCLTDRDSRMTSPLWRTADWTYLRMHSGRAHPRPCYGTRALRSWAARLDDLFDRDFDRYVYFNNDSLGCAVSNAATFDRLLHSAKNPGSWVHSSRCPCPG
jgi:uncharacterized protein YecE (DUF72 family)